jgi:hypothetical protein
MALAVAVPVALSGPSEAGAVTDVFPTATVHPGIELWIDVPGGMNGCTANFVYTNGAATFIGMAAHCAGTGGDTDTACNSPVLPEGAPVYLGEPVLWIDPSSGVSVSPPLTEGPEIGTMVYNSWDAMQQEGIADPSTLACQYNDLALIQVLPGVSVDPTVPVFGGPDGLAASGPAAGSPVYTYQNSTLRQGLQALSPAVGISEGPAPDSGGWSTTFESVPPSLPGDSGSGILDANGDAFGVLSTVGVNTGSSGATVGTNANTLALELAFLNATQQLGTVSLVDGTSPFSFP